MRILIVKQNKSRDVCLSFTFLFFNLKFFFVSFLFVPKCVVYMCSLTSLKLCFFTQQNCNFHFLYRHSLISSFLSCFMLLVVLMFRQIICEYDYCWLTACLAALLMHKFRYKIFN